MNTPIKEILLRLSKSQQELLIYAAQETISQFVEYQKGKYIGVHSEYNRRLVREYEDGVWSLGKVLPKTLGESDYE